MKKKVLEVLYIDDDKEYILCDDWAHDQHYFVLFSSEAGSNEVRGVINLKSVKTVRQLPEDEAEIIWQRYEQEKEEAKGV